MFTCHYMPEISLRAVVVTAAQWIGAARIRFKE